MKWVSAAFVFIAVTLISSFFLRNMFEGMPPLDVIVGVLTPLVLGLLCAWPVALTKRKSPRD